MSSQLVTTQLSCSYSRAGMPVEYDSTGIIKCGICDLDNIFVCSCKSLAKVMITGWQMASSSLFIRSFPKDIRDMLAIFVSKSMRTIQRENERGLITIEPKLPRPPPRFIMMSYPCHIHHTCKIEKRRTDEMVQVRRLMARDRGRIGEGAWQLDKNIPKNTMKNGNRR
jgi:hypothetical protein